MQVQYYLVPKSDKPFDVPAITARLGKLPGAFRHPDPKELTYIIAASAPMARYLDAKLRMDPRTSLVSQGLVTVYPRSLGIVQDAPAPILAQLEEFVTWVMKTYTVGVLSDEGEDWSARYAGNPRALFREEDSWA